MTLRQKLLGWKYQPEIVDLLLAGTSKDGLEKLLAGVEDLKLGSPELDIARMNLIGGLRSWGVQIPKKRGWYQVTGFEEPREKVPASEWEGEARETLDWVHTFPRLTPSAAEWAREGFKTGEPTLYHERSLGYLYCYECGARGVKGFLYSHPQTGNRAVVIQRFVTQPRLKVFQLNLDSSEIVDLARRLAPASVKSIRLLNVDPILQGHLNAGDLGASSTYRREAVYRCQEIADHPEKFWNRRGLSTLRKHSRETIWRPATPDDRSDMTSVIHTWKAYLESRHRQLAIGRDHTAVALFDALDMPAFIGFREEVPVCIHIFSQVEGTDVTGLVVEKSLNYREMVGGRYGTADYNLFKACEYFAEHGVSRINAGGYDGGGQWLAEHKSRFARKEDDVTSISVDLMGVPWRGVTYREE